MAKNQPVKQQPEAAAVIETNVSGELAGESPEHLAADTPRIDPGALSNTISELVSARVLCAVTIGANDYQPDEVIEGLPAVLVGQHAGSIDAHPDAVAHALSHGVKPKQFTAAE